MKKNLRAHLALIGANLIFGASYSIVKIITPGYMPAFALNAARVIVAIFFFTISFGFSGGRAWPAKKDWPLLALCSLTGIVINQLFFIKGVSMTSPIHSSLLSLATPLFITGIAAWLLRESFTILKAIGLLLGLSGAGMLILLKGSGNHSPDSLTGDILVLFNAISYSFYLVLIKPLMSQYQGTDILRWLFLLGAIIILPLGTVQYLWNFPIGCSRHRKLHLYPTYLCYAHRLLLLWRRTYPAAHTGSPADYRRRISDQL